MAEFQMNEAPADGISAVRFSQKSSQFLLVSSWDCGVRLYDIETKRLKTTYYHDKAVLDCAFSDLTHCFSGGLDFRLNMHDFTSQETINVGSHSDAIRCVSYSPDTNLIITGSWDRHVKLWDARTRKCVGSYEQPDKVYAMDVCGDRLVVGLANRKIKIWNLTNMNQSELRESSLKFQTRALKCFPNKQGYVISSIEGRAAVEYFDMDPEVQRKKYAFKCHRIKDNNMEYVYPVNAIAFHNIYSTFATGGSDCMVNIWDGFNKKRLCQFHSYPAGITSLSFDHTGNYLAIASSYNYENGAPTSSQQNNPAIYVRRVTEVETKPK